MDLLTETKAVLKSLLFSSPKKKMTIFELERDYLKSEGHGIPVFRLGYPNLKEYLLSIPDILTISHYGFVIPVTPNSRTEHIHVSENASEYNRYDNNSHYQRPHPRIKLEFSTRNSFNHDDLTEKLHHFGIAKNEASAECDEKEVEQVREIQEEIKEVKSKADADVISVSDGEAVPSLDEDDPIHRIGLPPLLKNKIPNTNVTYLKSSSTYSVFVTEINRQCRFWFQLCDQKKDIEMMEDQLTLCYNVKNTTMRVCEMIEGNACLVQYKKRVLRAEFMEKPVNDKIKVCFVDFGTIDSVYISECRRISDYWASIPKWCFPGALELIEPMNKEIEVAARFSDMVRNKPLCGYVSKVDPENHVVRIILIDTSDEKKDVIINRKLLAVCKPSG